MSQKIVYENPDGSISIVHPVPGIGVTSIISSTVPSGAPYEIIDETALPTDRLFRGAWTATGIGSTDATTITEDLTVAGEIAHDMRRAARNVEFAPYDELFSKQIPGTDLVAAEAAREEIRTRYAGIQSAIDAAADVVGIKSALTDRGII